MTKRKQPYQLPPGERFGPPLCDECRIDTLAVGIAPDMTSIWLCQPHLDRRKDQ